MSSQENMRNLWLSFSTESRFAFEQMLHAYFVVVWSSYFSLALSLSSVVLTCVQFGQGKNRVKNSSILMQKSCSCVNV